MVTRHSTQHIDIQINTHQPLSPTSTPSIPRGVFHIAPPHYIGYLSPPPRFFKFTTPPTPTQHHTVYHYHIYYPPPHHNTPISLVKYYFSHNLPLFNYSLLLTFLLNSVVLPPIHDITTNIHICIYVN